MSAAGRRTDGAFDHADAHQVTAAGNLDGGSDRFAWRWSGAGTTRKRDDPGALSRQAFLQDPTQSDALFRFDEVRGKQSWQLTLGGIAYPLFIVHWFIGTVVLHVWSSLTPKGAAHFLVSLAASLAVSLVLYVGVDRNVEKVRLRLKRRPVAAADAAWASRAVKPG